MSNERTFYVIANSKRAARRAANADPRWESGRTWLSDKAMATVLVETGIIKGRVYSFKVRADVESVELVR